jgi:signal transduction histidine kinase
MTTNVLDTGVVAFSSQGRLLEELGLRLVASPEIALVELIKNAYDADSPDCEVQLANGGDVLVVSDHGHGMSLDTFKHYWMQIGTGNKLSEPRSPRYERLLTGAKGIGRFAIRYLGDHLTLESTAFDTKRGQLTTLRANFNWPDVDTTADLSQARIPYQLLIAKRHATTGTTLTIGKLRTDAAFTTSRSFRSNVLKIVSPLQGLDVGNFHRATLMGSLDPGFKVILPGDEATSDANLAELILRNAWARLTISLEGNDIAMQVYFPRQKKPRTLKAKAQTAIKNGFFADIRFFPRRKGVFENKEVDGTMAWQWVRENSGVAVIDHGFRIKPYGFADDDWLNLDVDSARNRRDWRSAIAEKHFPIPSLLKPNPAANPALNLPYNAQLVGAVSIETNRNPSRTEGGDLICSMDREGLLGNRGSAELKEYVRGGIEFLAHCDKEELARIEAEEAKAAAKSARADIHKAISNIQDSPTLTSRDKARIVKNYSALADRLDEQEKYADRSRQSLMTMSLLGVVAGFMTHESDAILHELEQATHQIEQLAKRLPELKETSKMLSRRLETFRGFVEYSKLFTKKAAPDDLRPFSAAGQVRFVIARFKSFADDRKIDARCEIAKDVMSPAIPVSAYSGVLLNLYTNALKAILSVRASLTKPQIVFRGWNEDRKHIVEVLDNGVGVPIEFRKRIWDPLYTTTAYPENPLGPGMGLGLPLVRQVVRDLGGTVVLLPNAPAGFSSCFRVTFHAP